MSRFATTAEASMAARPRFERGPPGSGPGVVPVPPPRIGLDGRTRTSNPRLPTPVPYQLGHVHVSTDGRIRTDTDGGLSAAPLRVGLRQRGGPCGSRTRSLLLAGELRYQLRHRPR